jgi:hypothetical protein
LQGLASAYSALNEPEKAAIYQEAAKRLAATQPEPGPTK